MTRYLVRDGLDLIELDSREFTAARGYEPIKPFTPGRLPPLPNSGYFGIGRAVQAPPTAPTPEVVVVGEAPDWISAPVLPGSSRPR